MSKILLLEDDLSLISGFSFAFRKQGFELAVARTLKEANELWGEGKYDLLVLDVSLPDGTGFEFCEKVRQVSKVPIIFLTASDEEMNIIMGLDIGGDDYITKPFSIKELIARIQMHLRREERSHPASKEEMNSDITFYRDRQEVYYQSKRISLTKREFDLLYLLAKNENRIFSIEELYNYLYPVSSDAQLRSITEYIYQIRQKFKTHQIDPIKTVWGGGYKWKKN